MVGTLSGVSLNVFERVLYNKVKAKNVILYVI